MFIQLLADDFDTRYLILKDPFGFLCAVMLSSFKTIIYAISLTKSKK